MSASDPGTREAALLRLFEAAEEERRQVGRMLHDGAQQRLVAIGHFLDIARRKLDDDPAQAASIVERAAEEAREAGTELRDLSRELNPATLTERGLEPALTALAANRAVPVRLESVPAERLPEVVEGAVYRFVLEALVRMEGASEARVTVERHGAAVVTTVWHDGAASAEGRASDRIVALSGTVELETPDGGGVRLVATLPITEEVQ